MIPGGAATAGDGTPAVLRDGSAVLIRQVRSTDGPLLADGFARLSRQSRQARFLTGKISLPAAELHYLTSLDHHDHEALGALSHADGRGVGVARYVRDGHDPRTAEIAVAVTCYERSLDLTRGLADLVNEADTLASLGDVHQSAGDTMAARRAWGYACGSSRRSATPTPTACAPSSAGYAVSGCLPLRSAWRSLTGPGARCMTGAADSPPRGPRRRRCGATRARAGHDLSPSACRG